MRKSHVLLIAAGLVTGIFVAMVGSATEYDEIDTVAEGVYLVHGDDNRFRLAAEDAIKVLVYGKDGDLVLARQIDAGDERGFVLDDGSAIVALYGGQATLAAAGSGSIDRVPVEQRKVALVSHDGGSISENLTVQLPKFLVGVSGALQGEAHGVTVTATTEKGQVFSASDTELLDVSERMAVEALDAEVVDVTITAEHLDGTLYMVFSQPARGALRALHAEAPKVHARAEAEVERDLPTDSIEIHELTGMPLRFTVDREATMTFDVDGGHILDASLYSEDGTHLHHVHRGEDLGAARSGCYDVMDCWNHRHDQKVDEEIIELALDEGTYVLYIRAGWVDGDLSLTDSAGAPLIPLVEVLEPKHEALSTEDGFSLRSPVLDVGIESWGLQAFEEITLSIEGEPVYSYRALVNTFGWKIDAEHVYNTSMLAPGEINLTASGLAPNFFGFNEPFAWVVFVDFDAPGEDLMEHLYEEHDDKDHEDEDDEGGHEGPRDAGLTLPTALSGKH